MSIISAVHFFVPGVSFLDRFFISLFSCNFKKLSAQCDKWGEYDMSYDVNVLEMVIHDDWIYLPVFLLLFQRKTTFKFRIYFHVHKSPHLKGFSGRDFVGMGTNSFLYLHIIHK